MFMKKENSIDYLFARISRLHQSRIRNLLHKFDLDRGQPPILFMLLEKDGRTQREISDNLQLTPATISVMIQRMEKSGLLTRKTDEEDLRVTRVYLTEKSKELQPEIEDVFRQIEEETFSGFTMEEKILLRRFFLQIEDNLNKVK